MTLETFFEKFDLFADAPNAVAKMRELVRVLAVQGTLVPQNTCEEPGWRVLQKINTERLTAVKSRLISPMKPLPPVAEGEIGFELKVGWAPARLIELVMEIQTGPFGSSLHKSDYQPGGIPVINPASLRDGKIVPLHEMAITNATLKRLEVFKLCAGDIVMARRGEMGRCAIVTNNQEGWLCGTGSLVLRMPHSSYVPYVAMLIGSPMARSYLGGASVGTTMQNLNQSILAKMPVGVPPLAEQKRIVTKVDELMALCDRLEQQQQKRETRNTDLARASLTRFAEAPTPKNLNFLFHSFFSIQPSDLRKSILTLAVQGKIVPQDPNDEPVAQLLARSLAERRELKRTDATEVAALAGEEALEYNIPESWRWQRLDDLLTFGPTNGFSPKAVDYQTSVRSLSLRATTSGRFKGEHSKFITTEVPRDSDLWLRDGDILVQRGNTLEYVGVPAVYHGKPNIFIYPDLMMKLRVTSVLNVDFIHLAMSQTSARDFLRARASGTSGSMPKINQATLKSLPLPVPPLAEQRRIVAKVDQLMALVDQLETQLTASRTKAEQLLEALLSELTNPVGTISTSSQTESPRGPKPIERNPALPLQ